MSVPLTIAIPTYKRLSYLKEAVASVGNPQGIEVEILVGQDITPQGLEASIVEWCQGQTLLDPRFRYFTNSQNLGLAGNWNKLVREAKGDYVMIIGDDDLLSPTFLEKVIPAISQGADVVFTSQLFIDSNGKVMEELTSQLNKEYGRSNLQTGWLEHPIATVLNNSVPMSAAVIKRKWLEKFPFDISLNTPELEVFLKIAIEGGTFFFINEPLALYRIHQQSATSSGLTIHRLLRNLIQIEVPASYESLKKEFISSKILYAVNICLRSGEKELAKQLLLSSYYPATEKIKRLLQYALLHLPTSWVKKLI